METNSKRNHVQEKKKEKKGLYRTLTIIGYVFMIVGALIIAPVVCPPVFGYHTYTVAGDYSGQVKQSASLVYVKAADTYSAGNLVAVDNQDGDRDVEVYYIESAADGKVTLEKGNTIDTNQIVGRIVAKTPYFGYLSQLCFSVMGIILTVVIWVIAIVLATFANIIARKEKKKLA